MSPPSVADLLRAAAVMKRATELSSLHVLRLPGAILSPAVSYYGICSSPLLPSAPILENDSLHSLVRMWIEAVRGTSSIRRNFGGGMQINDYGKEGEKRERSDLSPFDIVPLLLLLLFRPSSTRDFT